MGLVHAEIELSNGRDVDDFEEGRILVDTARNQLIPNPEHPNELVMALR